MAACVHVSVLRTNWRDTGGCVVDEGVVIDLVLCAMESGATTVSDRDCVAETRFITMVVSTVLGLVR